MVRVILELWANFCHGITNVKNFDSKYGLFPKKLTLIGVFDHNAG